MQLYPPIHGASTVGEIIKASKLINETFVCDYVRVSTTPIGKGGLLKKIEAFILLYVKILKLLIKNNYDLVYATPCASGYQFYKDFGYCIISKLFTKNIAYHFHNKGISVNKFVPSFIMYVFFKKTKVILSAPSLFYDIERYVSKEDVYYCPYGINDDKHILTTTISKPLLKPKILFFAHMLREKGVFILLEACKILNEKNIDFSCNFVGSWYDIKKDEFYSFVELNNLNSKVTFHGPQYGSQKDKFLDEADIFAFPTYYKGECFPLGLLEALRWGLPVITTFEGAIPDIVDDGISGFIIQQKNASSLAEKLEILINNQELRQEMGLAGRTKYEQKFTLEKFETKLMEILNQMVIKQQ